MAEGYLNTQIIDQIKRLREELNAIVRAQSARKDAHILMDSSKKDLEEAKAKGKYKEVTEYQTDFDGYKTKFDTADADFNRLADQYLAKAPAEYEKISKAFHFYVSEFFDQGRRQSIDAVPGFQYQQMKGMFPSISVIPPMTVIKP